MSAEEIPTDVVEQVSAFHEKLNDVERIVAEHVSRMESEHGKLGTLEEARMELSSVYAANSLLWMYLCCKGARPKDNPALMKELERIKEYMARLKELEDRKLRPNINQKAAKAFVRNALFDPDAADGKEKSEEKNQESNAAEKDTDGPAQKKSKNGAE